MTPKAKIALKIFERDNFTCQYCRTRFSEDQPPLHVHHRIFTSQGGDNNHRNLVSCCFKCHHTHGRLKHAKTKFEDDYSVIDGLRDYYLSKVGL